MKIKRFNEEVGFDDEEMRDRLEIANLRGDFNPSSPSMKTYSMPQTKVNTDTELKKLLFREPILERFRHNIKVIEGSKLISFFATSKEAVDGVEYYAQLSFAFHEGQYYIGTIFRDRQDFEDESKWVKHTFFFDTIEDVYEASSAFVKSCKRLKVIDSDDLSNYIPGQN